MAIDYGFDYTRARTRVQLDAGGIGGAFAGSEKSLALIGSAQGGNPNVVHKFTSYSQAKQVLRGGDLLDALDMAWNPSPNQEGAGEISVIRVEDASQASFTNNGLTVRSKVYGADANDIQVTFEEDTTNNAGRFIVTFTRDRYERVYSHIGNIFNVQYTGEDAQASITIERNAEGTEATNLILSTGADAGSLTPVKEYPLGQGVYEDVVSLVSDINNLSDFEATMSTYGDKNVPTSTLDAVTGEDIKTESYKVKAVLGDIAKQVSADPYVELEADQGEGAPSYFGTVKLEGGSNGTTPPSWGEKIEMLSNVDGYYIVPLSDQASVHSEVSQFVSEQSANGLHMRSVVGSGIGETLEELRGRRNSLQNSRVMLTGVSGKRRMADGRVFNFPGYMFAALLAGLACGLPVGTPLTFKQVNIESLDSFFNGESLDQFDSMGVVMVEYVRNRQSTHFRIVSDVTTFNTKTEPVRNKNGLGEVSDFLTMDLREMLDTTFIGSRIQVTSAAIIKNAVESFLDQQVRAGLIVSYDPDDVQVNIDGNTATIYMVVTPAMGLEYINVFITYNNVQLSA